MCFYQQMDVYNESDSFRKFHGFLLMKLFLKTIRLEIIIIKNN